MEQAFPGEKKKEIKGKMDEFLSGLSQRENKKKLLLATEVLEYMKLESNPITCSNIGNFIGETTAWLKNYSPRVLESALKILNCLVDRMGYDFRPYGSRTVPEVLNNLSNAKGFVREECKILLKKIMEKGIVTPNSVFEDMVPCFTSKNKILRTETVDMMILMLEKYGKDKLNINAVIPVLSGIVDDKEPDIRSAVVTAFCVILKFTGDHEKLRLEIQTHYKGVITPERLDNLFKEFDKALAVKEEPPKPVEIPKPIEKPATVKVSTIPPKTQQEIRTVKKESIPNARVVGRPPTTMERKVMLHVDEIANLRSILASIVRRLDMFEKQLSYDNRNA